MQSQAPGTRWSTCIPCRVPQEGKLTLQRQRATELLDGPAAPREVASALRSLAFVNRWFGGSRVHRLLLAQAAQGRSSLSVLEAAAGHATALAAAARVLGRRGVTVQATLMDLHADHLPDTWPQSLTRPQLVAGNALRLPFPDGAFDVVSSCLFLHHLAELEAAQFLREAVRVARIAVIINDLERTRLHLLLARAFSLIDPSRLSRHDGPASVRQAFSAPELAALLRGTGAPFQLHRRFLFRHAAIIWCAGADNTHP